MQQLDVKVIKMRAASSPAVLEPAQVVVPMERERQVAPGEVRVPMLKEARLNNMLMQVIKATKTMRAVSQGQAGVALQAAEVKVAMQAAAAAVVRKAVAAPANRLAY